MKNYEMELMEMFTAKVQEYAAAGYMFTLGDSSMGYTAKMQMVHPAHPETFIRIYIENITVYPFEDNKYGLEEVACNVEIYELKVVEIPANETFEREGTHVLEEEVMYVIGRGKLTTDVEEANEANNKAISRSQNRRSLPLRKTFKPSRKLNVAGFKTAKKEDLKITRRITNGFRRSNIYIVKNIKTGKEITKELSVEEIK